MEGGTDALSPLLLLHTPHCQAESPGRFHLKGKTRVKEAQSSDSEKKKKMLPSPFLFLSFPQREVCRTCGFSKKFKCSQLPQLTYESSSVFITQILLCSLNCTYQMYALCARHCVYQRLPYQGNDDHFLRKSGAQLPKKPVINWSTMVNPTQLRRLECTQY